MLTASFRRSRPHAQKNIVVVDKREADEIVTTILVPKVPPKNF